MKKEISAHTLLVRKYPPGECVVISEVSDTTGGRNRSLDHMVLNIWPSRGHSIIGFERKGWRGDWLKELKNPEKQERHFKYCDYFYLLAENENVVKDVAEIPVTWGYMLIKGNKLYTIKDAPKLQPQTIPKNFMMAMIRRAYEKNGYVLREEIQTEIDAAVERFKSSNLHSIELLEKENEDYLKS